MSTEPSPRHHGRAELSNADRAWLTTVAHVLVPFALITTVCGAFLLAFDAWNAVDPLHWSVRGVGFCFSIAAVLITRYAGGGGDPGRAAFYAVVLALVSTYAVSTLADRGGWDMAVRTPVLLAGTWVVAHTLTRRLRLEVIEVEAPRGSWEAIDRLAVDRSADAGRHARRDALVLGAVMSVVVVFAGHTLGEAPARVQQSALNDAFAFVAGLAVVLAGGASYVAMRRAALPGGRLGLRGLARRLAMAFGLVFAGWLLGHVLFGTPVEPPMQGADVAETRAGEGSGDGAGGGGADRGGEDGRRGGDGDRRGDAPQPRRAQAPSASELPPNAGVVQKLAALIGRAVRLLFPVALILVACVAIVVAIRRIRRREQAAARDAAAGAQGEHRLGDPFAGLATVHMAGPERVVDESWRRARAWAEQTFAFDDSATPDQLASAVEAGEPELAAPFGVIAEAWQRATFGGETPDDDVRVRVLAALDALARLASRRPKR